MTTNLEQNTWPDLGLDVNLSDIAPEVRLDGVEDALKFSDKMNSMSESQEIVWYTIKLINDLLAKESQLIKASRYREKLNLSRDTLNKYFNEMNRTIRGVQEQIDYWRPDRKKIKNFDEKFRSYADEAKKIESWLVEMEQIINDLLEYQKLWSIWSEIKMESNYSKKSAFDVVAGPYTQSREPNEPELGEPWTRPDPDEPNVPDVPI